MENYEKLKRTIFISHATPEDNLFSLWLASRLSVLGYSAWVDLKSLGGGEDSWSSIEKIIREETVKFVFVVSCQSIKKQGTLKELALADRLKIENFVIPVNIDKVSPRELPAEIVRSNYLDFSKSWQDGFVELLDTLEKGDVLKSNSADQNMIASLKASLNLNSNRLIKNKHETYYSNWFEFKLPEKVYVYTVENLYGLNLENVPYQVKFEHDYIVSFACPKCLKESLKFNQFEDIDAAQFIEENHFQLSKRNSLIKDTKNKVVELLHGCFNDFMLDSLPYI